MQLISWIGAADLKGAGTNDPTGPIYATLKDVEFTGLHLLSDYPESKIETYLNWLQQEFKQLQIQYTKAQIDSPIDYSSIYQEADKLLTKIDDQSKENAILLSPGTPTMQAVWILIGKTKYPQIEYYQSSKEQGIQKIDIPFDISAEYLPLQQLTKLSTGKVDIDAAFDDIITNDPKMLDLKQLATLYASHDIPVLIYGESGTGKELFATAIHNASKRKDQNIVTVNCGAIPPELVDSEFFGHKKGAFTGATGDKKGYFQLADNGTLFLDEFGELIPSVQVRLLRALQNGEILPVGSDKAIKVNIRLITATNKDLMSLVAQGDFREDLFYRVAVGTLHLPPLRKRHADISLLAQRLLTKICSDLELPDNKKYSAQVKNFMLQHPWHGNIREMQATITRVVIRSNQETITIDEVHDAIVTIPNSDTEILNRDISQGLDIQALIDEVVQHYLPRALKETNENKTKAAKILGLKSYQTLNNWLETHNVK